MYIKFLFVKIYLTNERLYSKEVLTLLNIFFFFINYLIADPGVNLFILYLDISKIYLIFLSSKLQQFNNVLLLVAAPIPYITLCFVNLY